MKEMSKLAKDERKTGSEKAERDDGVLSGKQSKKYMSKIRDGER